MTQIELHAAIIKLSKENPLTLANNLMGYFEHKEVEEALFATDYLARQERSHAR